MLLRRPSEVPAGASSAVIGDIASPHNMAAALRDVDMVIHSAGLAHAMSGRPEDDYRTINTEATIRLAQAAERAGVKRFVFLSSIRAQSGPVAEGILTEAQEPQPTDPYGRSKLEAEQGLAALGLDWALPPRARLRARREGQHGGPAGRRRNRPLRRSVDAKRSLLSLDNLGGDRHGAEGARPPAAPLHRGRSGADLDP